MQHDPTDAERLAACVLDRGSASKAKVTRWDGDRVEEVQPAVRGRTRLGYPRVEAMRLWRDLAASQTPCHVRHAHDVVVFDVDTPAQARQVAMWLAEREAETGRAAHVATDSGTVDADGFHHEMVVVRDGDQVWREATWAALPGVARPPWLWGRALGSPNAKPDRVVDGKLWRLTATGREPISLAQGRRRLRRPAGTGKVRSGTGRPRTTTRERHQAAISAPPVAIFAPVATQAAELSALLPPSARAVLESSPVVGTRSAALLPLDRAVARRGFTAVQYHALLAAYPLGAKVRTVRDAAGRLASTHAYLAAHPDRELGGNGAFTVEQTKAAWDAVLGSLLDEGPVDVRVLAFLGAHRAMALAHPSRSDWLLSDRDLVRRSGISRRSLRAVETRQHLVEVVQRGSGDGGREATLYRLAGRSSGHFCSIQDHTATASRLHAVLAAASRACLEDPWQAGVLGPQHAVLWGLVTAGGVTSVEQAREVVAASQRTVRRWFEALAAAKLVSAGAHGRWTPGWDMDVAAWMLDSDGAVKGAAARNAAAVARERAVFDARVAALTEGDFGAAGLVLGRERLRTAQAARRPINPGRLGARLGDTEADELWEDPAEGLGVWVCPRDRRAGIDAVLEELRVRWDAGEHAAVVAAVAEWKAQHGLGIPTQRPPN